MDSIIERVQSDLVSNPDPTMYILDESQKDLYEQMKQMVKDDHGYLDIVLDTEDFNEVLSKLKGRPENIKRMFLLDFLINKILGNAGFETSDTETIWFDLMVKMLSEKCQSTPHQMARIHFFLDGVEDVMLQTKINDLFASRGLVTIGYTTKELLTYCDSKGNLLEPVHDYRAVYSDLVNKTVANNYQRTSSKFSI